MISWLIPVIGAVLAIAAGVGGWLLKWPFWLIATVVGGLLALTAIAWLVHLLLIMRRAKSIEKGVLAGGRGGTPELDAMREQFRQHLTALRASPSGKGALATLPWYLVLGAPGSGKTTLIQESGLAFSSLGHGLRSVRGIGGTRNCDWWFTDRAIFLDTAGRYTSQPEDQGEWLAFLDLVGRNRAGGLPINGILVVIAVPDILRDGGAGIGDCVRPLRERIVEASSRLGVVLPVYVVFTKADLLGGFKDFFAGLPRGERKQVWGFTLSAADQASRTVTDLYDEQIAALQAGLTAKRMAALLGERPPKELSKAVAFPGNFASVQDRLRTCVTELFRPFPVSDQPLLRGVYFTSALPTLKTGSSPNIATAGPKVPQIPPEVASVGHDVSIFFQPSLAANPRAAETDGARNGFFLGDLFQQVILGDGGLAGRPAGLRRLRRYGRAAAVYGSLAACLLISIWLVIGAVNDRALTAALGEAGTRLSLARDPAAQAVAREDLRQALAAVEAQATPWRRSAIAAVGQRAYFPAVSQTFLLPATRVLAQDLAAGLDRLGREGSFRDLFGLYAAYQQLAGMLPPDRELLMRTLVQTPRFAGLGAQPPGEAQIAEAGRHIDYLVRVMSGTSAWRIDPDKALLERVRSALGDNVWIQEGYGELIAPCRGAAAASVVTAWSAATTPSCSTSMIRSAPRTLPKPGARMWSQASAKRPSAWPSASSNSAASRSRWASCAAGCARSTRRTIRIRGWGRCPGCARRALPT